MSTTTSNLGLFKYDTSTDANTAFSIDTALNNNWDTLDSTIGNIETTISGLDPSDKVSKTGDTMTGNLIIEKDIPAITLRNSIITKGTTPSSNRTSSLTFTDSQQTYVSNFTSGYTTTGVIYTGLYAYQPVSGSSTSSSIRIYYPKTGDPYTYAPPSDTKNSILTTTGISKTQNGYLKLGNGVIIQWGKAGIGGKHREVSLPLSFTALTYPVTMTPYHTATSGNGVSYGWTVDVSEKSTSKFYFSHYSGYDNWYWHAIGY